VPSVWPRKLPFPPSAVTGPLGAWLFELWKYIESQPTVSLFSGVTPNSSLTGLSGDLAINVGSASTDTRAWILGGGQRSGLTNQGWVTLRTGPS